MLWRSRTATAISALRSIGRLSRIYRSGEISAIFAHSFGSQTQPSDTLQTLYLISALPE